MRRFPCPARARTVLILPLLVGSVAAEPIYRSVDAEGNVTFSSTPPVTALAVDEGPDGGGTARGP